MKKLILVLTLLVSSSVYAFEGVYDQVVATGRRTVDTAGTAVVLTSDSTICSAIVITAEANNTGAIVIGGSSVVANLNTRTGIHLSADDAITVPIDNLNELYLNAEVSGDGVTYIALR